LSVRAQTIIISIIILKGTPKEGAKLSLLFVAQIAIRIRCRSRWWRRKRGRG
jgi:hypothetical protein